jgi:hypothetical protein
MNVEFFGWKNNTGVTIARHLFICTLSENVLKKKKPVSFSEIAVQDPGSSKKNHQNRKAVT